MANNTFPSDWRDEPCFVVAIPRPLVPYVGGLLRILEQKGFWSDSTSYVAGYAATLELERCLMATCLTDLLEQNDALYRMVNTALFGVTYSTVSTDPLVVTPAIAPHVTLDIHDQDSLIGRMDRLTQLLDASVNGTETPLYTIDPAVRPLLQSILDNLTSGDTDLTTLISDVEGIAVLLG